MKSKDSYVLVYFALAFLLKHDILFNHLRSQLCRHFPSCGQVGCRILFKTKSRIYDGPSKKLLALEIYQQYLRKLFCAILCKETFSLPFLTFGRACDSISRESWTSRCLCIPMTTPMIFLPTYGPI